MADDEKKTEETGLLKDEAEITAETGSADAEIPERDYAAEFQELADKKDTPRTKPEDLSALLDKRSVLKMKQGIADEDEEIPLQRRVMQEKKDLHGWAWISNFLYHYKIHLIAGIFLATVLVIMLYSVFSRERYDLTVMMISSDAQSDMVYRVKDTEEAFEAFCPDYDGNGETNVEVRYIDLQQSGDPNFDAANRTKLLAEMTTGTVQLYLLDKATFDYIEEGEDYSEFFISLSDIANGSALEFNNQAFPIAGSEFASLARWESAGDNVFISVRNEFDTLMADLDEAGKTREKALEVVGNIIADNKINQ